MPLSLEDITYELHTDTRPNGPDGCSNTDRLAYVLDIFECDHISLNEEYDWTQVTKSDDLDMVQASKHLALLQLDYFHRMYQNRHMDLATFNVKSSVLFLGLQRINWHIDHMERGVTTPPFPSIH